MLSETGSRFEYCIDSTSTALTLRIALLLQLEHVSLLVAIETRAAMHLESRLGEEDW